ncbi:MAG: hypothetical protein QOD64_1747, partial [Verrucomicrobiota bacterium]
MFTSRFARSLALIALLFVTGRFAQASDEILNVNYGPCGFGWASWCSFTWDTGRIEVAYHIAPGTPDGSYPIEFPIHTNYTWGGYTANVTNGVGSPTVIVDDVRGWECPDLVHITTAAGASASLTRNDVYWGQLGQPYDGPPAPPVQTKVAILDVYIGTVAPTPPAGANTKPNDPKLGGDQCPRTSAPPPPMARYSVHSTLVSLNIEDRPLRYTPPFGPAVDFTVTYNQRETQQPATFAYSNLGPKWTFDWLSYVTDDPNTQLPLTGLYRSGGGAEIFAFDFGSQTFTPDPQSHATLVKTGAASYERRLPDGSKQVFGISDASTSYPRRVFMTQIVDPAGNALSIGYDASFRVTTITDALSQVTNVS